MKTIPVTTRKNRGLDENACFRENLAKKMDENERFLKIGQRSIVQ